MIDARAKFEACCQAGSRRSREPVAPQVGRRSTEWRARLPGPPESLFVAGVGAAILDGGSKTRTGVRQEGFSAALLGPGRGPAGRALGRVPRGAERECDDAGTARGPVPWAGDTPNVTASRSLTHRGEEERTRRRHQTTGHGGGSAPSGRRQGQALDAGGAGRRG